jgi:hypothetical protein
LEHDIGEKNEKHRKISKHFYGASFFVSLLEPHQIKIARETEQKRIQLTSCKYSRTMPTDN